MLLPNHLGIVLAGAMSLLQSQHHVGNLYSTADIANILNSTTDFSSGVGSECYQRVLDFAEGDKNKTSCLDLEARKVNIPSASINHGR